MNRVQETEWQLATNQIQNNDEKGLLFLYAVYKKGLKDVADSEIAEVGLDYYLYEKPSLWIKTFSKLQDKEFQWEIKMVNEMAEYDNWTNSVISPKQFGMKMYKNLMTFHGTVREEKFAKTILKTNDRFFRSLKNYDE